MTQIMRLVVSVFFVGFILAEHPAAATTITWNGTASSNWNNPTNWIPQQVPTAADHIVFNSGNLTAPTNGAFAVMDWAGGNLYGALTVGVGGVLNVNGSGTRGLYGVLTNLGTVAVSGSGYVQEYYAAGAGYYGSIYNGVGGVFDVQNDTFALYNVTGAETFNNAGTLRKSGGPGTTTIGPQVNNAPTGVVEAQVGTLNFTGGGSIGGHYTAAAGATVAFGGGNYSDGAGPQFSGAGAFKFNGGNLLLGQNVIPGLQLLGGNLTLGPGFQGGSITNLTGAGITMLFTNTVTGALNWMAGNLYGALTVGVGGVLNVNGSGTRGLYGVLTNLGTVAVSGSGYVQEYYAAGAGYYGSIYNGVGGVFDVQNDTFALYNVTGAETFNNAGTLRKSGGPGTTTIGPQVNNAPTGVVEAQVGTLSLTGGGVLGSGSLRCGITSLGSYGRINFPGTVTLSGTIGAVLLGSFVPPINSTFSLVTCASHTGAFASLALPPVAIWATNYTATSFTVTVTSLNNLAPTQSGQWTGNGFVLSLNGPNDLGTNIVYASTNLQNWAPIYTNPPTNGIIQFLDTDSKKFRMRFYRTAEQ